MEMMTSSRTPAHQVPSSAAEHCHSTSADAHPERTAAEFSACEDFLSHAPASVPQLPAYAFPIN